jgi:hypothetical protein
MEEEEYSKSLQSECHLLSEENLQHSLKIWFIAGCFLVTMTVMLFEEQKNYTS